MSDIGDPTFHCVVEYDVDVPCVSMIWKGYATALSSARQRTRSP